MSLHALGVIECAVCYVPAACLLVAGIGTTVTAAFIQQRTRELVTPDNAAAGDVLSRCCC